MTLTERIADRVRAAFTGLWIQTPEADEAERDLLCHGRDRNWKAAVWDVAHSLRLPHASGESTQDSGAGDPPVALFFRNRTRYER